MAFIKRRCKKQPRLQLDFQQALTSYHQAQDKINEVLDVDLVDAAVYEYLAAEKRLNYLIRMCRQKEAALLS